MNHKINNILQFQTHHSFCQTCLLTGHQATFSLTANYLHISYTALYKCMFCLPGCVKDASTQISTSCVL